MENKAIDNLKIALLTRMNVLLVRLFVFNGQKQDIVLMKAVCVV